MMHTSHKEFSSRYMIRIFISTLALGMFLSSCSVLPKPKDAPVVYRLTLPKPVNTVSVEKTKIVNIENPTASKALSGMDIVLSPDGRRLTMAGGAHWEETVPALLRNVLIDTLANNQHITGIIPKGNTRVPYRLNMDIRRFEAVFDNGEGLPPIAVVQLNLSLTDTKTRKLIAAYSVNTQQRAGAVSVSSIVMAHDIAAREAMGKISTWLSAQLQHKSF